MDNFENNSEDRMSPVLNNSNSGRELLLKLKSRIKLTDRFEKKFKRLLNNTEKNSQNSSEDVKTAKINQQEELPNVNCEFRKPSLEPQSFNCGFTTVTGAEIMLSKDRIKEQSKLFEDILNPSAKNIRSSKFNFIAKTNNNVNKCFDENFKGFNKLECEEAGNKLTNLLSFYDNFKKFKERDVFLGFSEIDKETLKKCNYMRNYVEIVETVNVKVEPTIKVNQTPTREVVSSKLEDDFIQKPERILENIKTGNKTEAQITCNPNQNKINIWDNCNGFQAASGKELKVTNKALESAKIIFNSISNEPVLENICKSSFKSNSSTTSKEFVPERKDNGLRITDKISKRNNFEEFKTASGKSFKVENCEPPLKKIKLDSQYQFDDDPAWQSFEKNLNTFENSNNDKKIDKGKAKIEKKSEFFNFLPNDPLMESFEQILAKSKCNKSNNNSKSVVDGFQLASTSKLQTSINKDQNQISKLQKMPLFGTFDKDPFMREFEATLAKNKKSNNSNCFASFQTAGGTKDTQRKFDNHKVISEKSLEKPKEIPNKTNAENDKTAMENTSNTDKLKEEFYNSEDLLNLTIVFEKAESILQTSMENNEKSKIPSNSTISKDQMDLDRTFSPLKNKTPNIFSSTPMKTPNKRINSTFLNQTNLTPIKEDEENEIKNWILERPIEGRIEYWKRELEKQKNELELKLKEIIEIQSNLNLQSELIKNKALKNVQHGVLYNAKQNKTKIKLNNLLRNINKLEINPENAENLHLKLSGTIKTKDGALIIGNSENLIGLPEIEMGFKTIPGVFPNLLPTGWIRNHFKWIVWKLASYVSNFPDLDDCLNIENIMEQLKYRYDREIDKAERSALRKIFEKDDCSQKRMVLCVSGINRNGIKLTDGWYEVETTIDGPLKREIHKKNIIVGTKLVICGGELLNCDGCHPLNAPQDLIKLKINYNSTRRSKWWTKLGYQKFPEPFPVPLKSIAPEGGLVGCIKVCILRIYPIRFMERLNSKIIWRNRKAEELRQTEWENECINRMEENNGKFTPSDKRDVTPLLKLLLLDGSNKNGVVFNLWKPTDEMHCLLKEGCFYKIFNVIPRYKDGLSLSSTMKTVFKNLGKTFEFSEYERKYSKISQINSQFGEFDTVGVIVEIKQNSSYQNMWLTDSIGTLMFIEIFEGPNSCALLGNLNKGQTVALSNLILKKTKSKDFIEAIANHFTIVSIYPQQKHLQEGLNQLRQELPENLDKLLREAEEKVTFLMNRNEIELVKNSDILSSNFDDSDDESTLVLSRMTSIDLALSRFDMDKIVT